jgi:hypothetical protein
MKFRQIYENYNNVYKFSSVQLNFDSQISSLVQQFGNILLPEPYLYFDERGEGGRENQIHCTVLYGIESASSIKARKVLKSVNEFEVELGDISFFEQNENDVMKIEVHSEYLHQINSLLRNGVDYQNNYPNYEPHCTVAYIQKNVKEKMKYDKSYFKGLKQIVRDLEFSSKDGSREMISLKYK